MKIINSFKLSLIITLSGMLLSFLSIKFGHLTLLFLLGMIIQWGFLVNSLRLVVKRHSNGRREC